MALARMLQEQERAYFALQFNENSKNNDDNNNNANNSATFEMNNEASKGNSKSSASTLSNHQHHHCIRDESPLGTNTLRRSRTRGDNDGVDDDLEDGLDDDDDDDLEEEEEEEEEMMDPSEALARRLMEEEERAHSERMLAYAGVNQNNMNDIGMMNEDIEDDDVQDPDDMTYEELLQLGDVVGRQATGMDSAQIKKFCLLKTYEKKKKTTNVVEEEEEEDSCSVCRCEFESGEMIFEMILMMKCKHGFHEECLRPWLKEYKTCPLCKTECM